MAIYNISEKEESLPSQEELQDSPAKGRLFSAIAARFFFLFLFIANILWGMYAFLLLCASLAGSLFHKKACKEMRQKSCLTLRRAFVCGVALFVSLFSPAFGLMIACGYFLVYDRNGIHEVVPSSLQDQFKGLFNN